MMFAIYKFRHALDIGRLARVPGLSYTAHLQAVAVAAATTTVVA